jgi:hypothetical protein
MTRRFGPFLLQRWHTGRQCLSLALPFGISLAIAWPGKPGENPYQVDEELKTTSV